MNEWRQFADEWIPNWVKDHYSPKESWKGKPFSKADADFFYKGIRELSHLLTQERGELPGRRGSYLEHARFRSAYILYFLPMQAAKFSYLLERHHAAVKAVLDGVKDEGVLKFVDLGAGPGTASFGLLFHLLKGDLANVKRLEFHWVDRDFNILRDGKNLAEYVWQSLQAKHPSLKAIELKIQVHKMDWRKFRPIDADLVLVGHLLNEIGLKRKSEAEQTDEVAYWQKHAAKSNGGILFIEPAAKPTSQSLSQLRDRLVETQGVWGPCLHRGICPLAVGRDWCHFSFPVVVEGKWYQTFAGKLAGKTNKTREWIKLSYLWIAGIHPASKQASRDRLVVSDLLTTGVGRAVLTCEPERPGRVTVGANSRLKRGDRVLAKPE